MIETKFVIYSKYYGIYIYIYIYKRVKIWKLLDETC